MVRRLGIVGSLGCGGGSRRWCGTRGCRSLEGGVVTFDI